MEVNFSIRQLPETFSQRNRGMILDQSIFMLFSDPVSPDLNQVENQ